MYTNVRHVPLSEFSTSGVVIAALFLLSYTYHQMAVRDVTSLTRPQYQQRFSAVRQYSDVIKSHSPTVYVITPTYERSSQRPDVTRLAQTLMLVNDVHWILVEDSPKKTVFIQNLLKDMRKKYTHLNVVTSSMTYLRGMHQRNAGLKWLLAENITDGVIYFADDDNSYDRRLFDDIRTTEKVGMFPVGNFDSVLSTPVVKNGRLVDFADPWIATRKWPIDMAVFCVNIRFWRERGSPLFTTRTPGYQETSFLTSLNLTRSEVEPKAKNATEIWAWHTKTVKAVGRESYLKQAKFNGTNINVLYKKLYSSKFVQEQQL